MKQIGTKIKEDKAFLKRADHQKDLIKKLKAETDKVKLGGGKKSVERQKAKGKLTARERIELLVDAPKEFYELSTFAAYDMYKDFGGAASAGTVYGIGKVSGRLCIIVANDATVKAGAWFPITVKKNLRAQEICLENKLPIIYLVDSAGVFLPIQDEIFPDKAMKHL
jgi:acetyl-CoA carboxylase carboxyltransferase component